MQAARSSALFLLLVGWPAAAETMYTLPRQPVDSYPTRVVIDTDIVTVSQTSVSIVERQGNLIKIVADVGGCVITCDPQPAPVVADLDTLAAGDYEVQLWIAASGPSDWGYLFDSYLLRVVPGPRLSFIPPRPVAGEAVTLRIENLGGNCQQAEVSSAENFRFEVAAVLDGCPIDPPEYVTLELPLGNPAAGVHQVDLIAGQHLAAASFEVIPATTRLQDGRFEVAATWRTALGEAGPARLVQPPSRDSALFYFFSPDNWELMVKVLDGCAINGNYWVFSAASTDVAFAVTVRQEGGEIFEVRNLLGQPAAAINSINAFPCI
jgi:hypothetical protein